MKTWMVQGAESQDLAASLIRADRLVAAAQADFDSGVYSRYTEHLQEHNRLILSLSQWNGYKDFYGIPRIRRRADISPEQQSALEKAKLEEILSKARLLREALGGVYRDAQICLSGHVQHSGDMPFDSGVHCTKCGAPCIDRCTGAGCGKPIRGVRIYAPSAGYLCPQFCHACGLPYPWMKERLNTAHELLDKAPKLTQDERNNLFRHLEFVMSNPDDYLAPAKRKLIEIGLEKAPSLVRELILDLMAKVVVESTKGP